MYSHPLYQDEWLSVTTNHNLLFRDFFLYPRETPLFPLFEFDQWPHLNSSVPVTKGGVVGGGGNTRTELKPLLPKKKDNAKED